VEDTDFLEYLEMQDSLDMVSKSDLLEKVREVGGRLTDRQLTTYISEVLVPKSARIGSRAGAFPRIVVDLLTWIDHSRQRGLSVEAIKELLPLWKFLQRSCRRGELDFSEFEYVARQFVRSSEAGFAVPTLFDQVLPCPVHETNELRAIKFTLKNGRVIDPLSDEFVPLSFTLYDFDDNQGSYQLVAEARFAIPLSVDDDAISIVLGIPNGEDVPPDPAPIDRGDSLKEPGTSRKEAHAIEGG
jgi:DNA-binding transcriptional MerR regulator